MDFDWKMMHQRFPLVDRYFGSVFENLACGVQMYNGLWMDSCHLLEMGLDVEMLKHRRY